MTDEELLQKLCKYPAWAVTKDFSLDRRDGPLYFCGIAHSSEGRYMYQAFGDTPQAAIEGALKKARQPFHVVKGKKE